MAESSPPPKRKRGRPPIYVLGHDGKPIVGMSLHKADGRYLVTGSKPPHYLGTNFDEALVEFREYQARQRKEFESVPAERPAGAAKGKDFEKGTPDIYVDVPTETYTASVLSSEFWSKVGWAIRKNPHLAAERTGLPLDRLEQFKRPEESVPLTEIGKAYFDRPKPMSSQYKHDTTHHWNEFVEVVGLSEERSPEGRPYRGAETMGASVVSVEKMLFELGWSGVNPLTTLAEICLAYIRAGGDTATVVRRIDSVIGDDGDSTDDCIHVIGIFLDEARHAGRTECLRRPGTREPQEVLDEMARFRGDGGE